jgi:AcrR family transcriptional regulator
MSVQARAATPPPTSPPPGRTGRPRKQAGVAPTKDRLIDAAIEVFVERGFNGTSIGDIAALAGVSGPAVYKHFDGKADLLIQAARRSLLSVPSADRDETPDPIAACHRWLAPDFEQTRRLLLELHVSAQRHDELMLLLGEWHRQQANSWRAVSGDSTEQVTAFYLLLLGLAQIDSLSSLGADPVGVRSQVDTMIAALFPHASSNSPTSQRRKGADS